MCTRSRLPYTNQMIEFDLYMRNSPWYKLIYKHHHIICTKGVMNSTHHITPIAHFSPSVPKHQKKKGKVFFNDIIVINIGHLTSSSSQTSTSHTSHHIARRRSINIERATRLPAAHRPAPRLPACDRLHVWTHPRRTASAAFHPCRQKDYPFLVTFTVQDPPGVAKCSSLLFGQ